MNHRTFWRWLGPFVVLAMLLGALPALAAAGIGDWGPARSGTFVEGVASDSPAPAPPHIAPTATPPPPGAIVINFDDVTAPCNFMDTIALRDEYAGLGVLFMGPAPLDGGGIVDQCGNWGVSGHSAPNFLGFNADASFSDGGIPRQPEIITFTNKATYVQVNAGSASGAGQIVTMEAFDAQGQSLGTDSLILAATLDTLSITATNIAYVVIDVPILYHFVLDDLAFLEPSPDIVVTPASLSAEQCPDTQTTQELAICNLGSLPLEWSLSEQPAALAGAGIGDWGPDRPEAARSGTFVEGVASDSPAPAPPHIAPTATPPPPGAIVINFDNVTAPCSFMDTIALRDEYAGLGALFMGPAPLDGGGIVDQCGGWGVSGHSAPNFLGFNADASFADGGIPRPPEIITFTHKATYVQVNAGSASGAGQIITMEAFDAQGQSLGTDSLILATTLDTLSITATNIAYVVIDVPILYHFVLDDLAFLYDIPWLAEEPLAGTVPVSQCQYVTVTFDSAGLAPGVYAGFLRFLSNDPLEPEITLPVTMTVDEAVNIVDVATATNNLTVAFTPTVAGTMPIDYLWDLGDGVTSTLANPIHTYDVGGCYDVSLDVANGCSLDSWVGEVCVCDPLHDTAFTWLPADPLVDEVVYFTATAAGTGPITYEWDLGDGTPLSGQYVNHTYAATGAYTVILTVTNGCDSDVVSHPLSVVAGPAQYTIYLPLVNKNY